MDKPYQKSKNTLALLALLILFSLNSQLSIAKTKSTDVEKSYIIVSLEDADGACVITEKSTVKACKPVSEGIYLGRQSELRVLTGSVSILSLKTKRLIELRNGSHKLIHLEARNSDRSTGENRLAQLLDSGYRNTASVATRSKSTGECFQKLNLEKEFWAINCKLQATKHEEPKQTIAEDLPKASNYRSLPVELAKDKYDSNHYLASTEFCLTLNKHSIGLAEKAFNEGKSLLIFSPKGYDWDETSILPLPRSCERSLQKEIEKLDSFNIDESLRHHLLHYVYKEHGLIYEASQALKQTSIN